MGRLIRRRRRKKTPHSVAMRHILYSAIAMAQDHSRADAVDALRDIAMLLENPNHPYSVQVDIDYMERTL